MKLPQFIPILTTFTARVAGRETAQLLQSPTALARALADTQKVVGHDGVLCVFDPLLLSSACSRKHPEMTSFGETNGPGLVPPDELLQAAPVRTILESIHPLQHHLPGHTLVYATFAGPGLLYSQLQETFESCGQINGVDPDYVVDVILKVVRSSLDLKVDGIALIEQPVTSTPPELLRVHKTVRKLADFYDTGFLLFRLPGTDAQEPGLPAHCVFDLSAGDNGIGPAVGQLGQLAASYTAPITTAGDVPAAMTIEGLKTLLQEGRTA